MGRRRGAEGARVTPRSPDPRLPRRPRHGRRDRRSRWSRVVASSAASNTTSRDGRLPEQPGRRARRVSTPSADSEADADPDADRRRRRRAAASSTAASRRVSLAGWTTSGTTGIVTSPVQSGVDAGRGGSTAVTNGDSSISQTFAVPARGGTLSFWYQVHCPDSVAYDWAAATLRDNVTGSTTTLLAPTCTNTDTWAQVSANLGAQPATASPSPSRAMTTTTPVIRPTRSWTP